MSYKVTGGPAFPNATISGKMSMTESGMTLRDYFAAKAMHGMLTGNQRGTTERVVEDAYRIADAMLKAREVKP